MESSCRKITSQPHLSPESMQVNLFSVCLGLESGQFPCCQWGCSTRDYDWLPPQPPRSVLGVDPGHCSLSF